MTRSRCHGHDSGFTLIELLVVLSIASVLASISAFGFWNWRLTAQHQGSAQQLVSQLRSTSERAIAEGRTYCVDFAATGRSYKLWQRSCADPTGPLPGTFWTQSANVATNASQTVPPPTCPALGTDRCCPTGHRCIYFLPRGMATQTDLTVTSTARSRIYIVHVEGLTARVWM